MATSATTSNNNLPKAVQYIDLMGEPPPNRVCHGATCQVILRRARDVVFDIKIGDSATYTVYAEHDLKAENAEHIKGYNFRDTRKKPLVKEATFKDGEMIHLLVGRNFRGDLVLKRGGKIVARYPINVFDNCLAGKCTDAPEDKPAPIMIIVRKKSEFTTKNTKELGSTKQAIPPLPVADAPHAAGDVVASRPVQKIPTILASNVSLKAAPKHLWKTQHGSPESHTWIAEIEDIRNPQTLKWLEDQWIKNKSTVNRTVSASTFIIDNREWLYNSIHNPGHGFTCVRAKLIKIGNKSRIVFAGYRKGNKVFRQGAFSPESAHISTIMAGAGSAKGAFKASWRAAAGSIKGTAIVNSIFVVAEDYIDWRNDTKETGYDFVSKVMVDIVEAITEAAVSSLIVAALCTMACAAVGTAGLPVIVVGAIFILVGVGVDALASWVDDETHWKKTVESIVEPVLEKTIKFINEEITILNKYDAGIYNYYQYVPLW